MLCTLKCLHLLRNRSRNVGGKRRCHNITGIMQNMSVVPGGKLHFFLQPLPPFPTEGDSIVLFSVQK